MYTGQEASIPDPDASTLLLWEGKLCECDQSHGLLYGVKYDTGDARPLLSLFCWRELEKTHFIFAKKQPYWIAHITRLHPEAILRMMRCRFPQTSG